MKLKGVLIFIILFLSISVSNAEDSSMSDLQVIIDNADNAISLESDYSFAESDDGVVIEKDIRIYGNNHTIDARNSSRPFLVQDSNLYIENVNFINAGGCAFTIHSSSFVIRNCTFINNSGGAIMAVSYLNSSIDNCLFENNAASSGAAVHLYKEFGDFTISNSIFNNNSAGKRLLCENDYEISLLSYNNLLDNQMFCYFNRGDFAVSFVNVSYNGFKNQSFVYSIGSKDNFGLPNRTIILEVYENDTLVLNKSLVTDDDGIATIDYSPLKVGNYKIKATCENLSLTKNVFARMLVNFTMSVGDICLGDDIAVNYSISADAKGQASIAVWNPQNYYSRFNFPGATFIKPLWKSNLALNESSIMLPYFDVGTYLLVMSFDGDEYYFPKTLIQTFNVVPINREGMKTFIEPQIFDKYFGGDERLIIKLTDENNQTLSDKTISIKINGITYNRTTDSSGLASIAVNLNPGRHQYLVIFDGDEIHSASSGLFDFEIKSTFKSRYLGMIDYSKTMFYVNKQSKNHYVVGCLDSNGNDLKGGAVEFNINGVLYKRQINENGEASLSINLDSGKYIITTKNLQNGETKSSILTILPTIVDNHDLVKYCRNDSQFTVKLEGICPWNDKTVTFNINGVMYERKTDKDAIAKLNINLAPGKYIITSMFEGCMVSNKITVLPILEAEDLVMQYRDGSTFDAMLLDGQGNPLKNTNVTFNINGVFYNRTTDDFGIARLNINLMSGEYIITSSYNGCNIANKITISS